MEDHVRRKLSEDTAVQDSREHSVSGRSRQPHFLPPWASLLALTSSMLLGRPRLVAALLLELFYWKLKLSMRM